MSKPVWVIIAGGILFVAGAITTGIYFEQPWRTCIDDSASDACPMLPQDFAVMQIAVTVTLVGMLAVLVGVVLQVYRVSKRR